MDIQSTVALAAIAGIAYLTYADVPQEKEVEEKVKSVEDTGIMANIADKSFHYSGTNSDKDLFTRPEMLPVQPKPGLLGKLDMVKFLRQLVASKEEKIKNTITKGAIRDSRIDGVWKPPIAIPKVLPAAFTDITKHKMYNPISPYTASLVYDVPDLPGS